MLDRLLGLETEYAIRFAPSSSRRPTNARVFEAYADAVRRLGTTRPGMRDRELFVANGGAIHYEAQPIADDDGLVEGATPECRGPSAALLYQRAQDALLIDATPLAAAALDSAGYPGQLGLLKNCRDAAGHWYGAQENYEVEIARGAALVVWRAGLVALLPLCIAAALASWALVIALFAIALPVGTVAVLGSIAVGDRREVVARRVGRPALRASLLAVVWLERGLWEPVAWPFLLLFRAVAFRRVRRALVPFLMTRAVFTGAGTLEGVRFALSEKAVSTRRLCRSSLGTSIAVFDAGNLCKHLTSLAKCSISGYLALFGKRQRLQLGLSDSNMAQGAEYMKLATASLVIDLAEAGALDDLPAMRRPLRTLHRIVRSTDLALPIAIQRQYVDRARRFVRDHPAPSLEAAEIIERWTETLDALERDPEELFGYVDWVTKRHLIRAAASTPAEQKKIDLKYHELGDGYFARLERAGFAASLVTADEIWAARHEPPPDSPARARARVMRDLLDEAARVRITWDRVHVGNRVTGRVIRLDDHR